MILLRGIFFCMRTCKSSFTEKKLQIAVHPPTLPKHSVSFVTKKRGLLICKTKTMLHKVSLWVFIWSKSNYCRSSCCQPVTGPHRPVSNILYVLQRMASSGVRLVCIAYRDWPAVLCTWSFTWCSLKLCSWNFIFRPFKNVIERKIKNNSVNYKLVKNIFMEKFIKKYSK